MKDLKSTLITEHSISKMLLSVKYNFTSNYLGNTKEIRTKNAKLQELEIITNIKDKFPDWAVYTSKEYAEEVDGINWSPEYDLKYGDIVIDTGADIYFIDVKIASETSQHSEYILGPIDINSILNFANKRNHIYLIFNYNNTFRMCVDGQKLYKLFMSDPVLNVSNHRTNILPNFKAKFINKDGSTRLYNADINDFIPTKWLRTNMSKINM